MQRLCGFLILSLLPASLLAMEGTFINPGGLRIQMVFRANGKVQVTSRIINAPIWYNYTQSGKFIYIEDPSKGQVEMEIRGGTLWTSAAFMDGTYYPEGSAALAEAEKAKDLKKPSDASQHTDTPASQTAPVPGFDLLDLELQPDAYKGREYSLKLSSSSDSVIAFRTSREEHYGYINLSEINQQKAQRWMLLFRKDAPALIKEANRRLSGRETVLNARVRYLGMQSLTNYFGKPVEMPCLEIIEFRE